MSSNNFKGNKLTIYLFGDNAKTITTRTFDNQSWYMAADICRLVGISNHSKAVHDERTDRLKPLDCERRKESIHIGNYGKDQVLLVNNGGMLKLIYQANTSAAEAIRVRIENIPRHLIPSQWQHI
jgi:prophage antirepressor-like protein